MLRIYQILSTLLIPVIIFNIFIRIYRKKEDRLRFIERFGKPTVKKNSDYLALDRNLINKPLSIKIISNEENKLCVSYEKSKINIDQIINYLIAQNIKIFDISTDDGDLEDVFLRLTKN